MGANNAILVPLLGLPPPSSPPQTTTTTTTTSTASTASTTTSKPHQYPSFRLEKYSFAQSHILGGNPAFPFPQKFFASPTFSQLKELTLEGYNFEEDDIEFLFKADRGVMKHLTHLHLWECSIKPGGLQALARSPYLSNLTSLKLNGNCVRFITDHNPFVQPPYLWTPNLWRLLHR